MGGAAGDATVLLCDKSPGMTSHDLVEQVRRQRGGKVGHAGTLDPFATGLLVLLLGRATRLQRYLLPLPKTYLATARLGWRSSTGDPDGELVHTGRLPRQLRLPTGRVSQKVPMTSAVRIEGERLYKKAHRGERVETPEREVEVYRAELLDSDEERATYEIECSSGTYVRVLIETLGDAYCEELRRTRIGELDVGRAGEEISPAEALDFLPAIELDDDQARAISHGRAIRAHDERPGVVRQATTPGRSSGEGVVRLLYEHRLLGVARQLEPAADDGVVDVKPEVVLG